MNYVETMERILSSNGGYITRRDIDEKGIPSIYLSRFVASHALRQIERGFYASQEWIVDRYVVFQYTYPKYIYSFNSAVFLHGLGDILPNYLEVTGPLNYRPFPKAKEGVFTHTDTRNDTYHLGITLVDTGLGNKVKAYDMEKTLCDFIRNKEKVEFETYVKAIRSYARRKEKDVNRLMQYAKAMRIEDKVRSVMEVMINGD